jgi:hypothetical protein
LLKTPPSLQLGTSFDVIIDVVRREIALSNLADSRVSLTGIAEKA